MALRLGPVDEQLVKNPCSRDSKSIAGRRAVFSLTRRPREDGVRYVWRMQAIAGQVSARYGRTEVGEALGEAVRRPPLAV